MAAVSGATGGEACLPLQQDSSHWPNNVDKEPVAMVSAALPDPAVVQLSAEAITSAERGAEERLPSADLGVSSKEKEEPLDIIVHIEPESLPPQEMRQLRGSSLEMEKVDVSKVLQSEDKTATSGYKDLPPSGDKLQPEHQMQTLAGVEHRPSGETPVNPDFKAGKGDVERSQNCEAVHCDPIVSMTEVPVILKEADGSLAKPDRVVAMKPERGVVIRESTSVLIVKKSDDVDGDYPKHDGVEQSTAPLTLEARTLAMEAASGDVPEEGYPDARVKDGGPPQNNAENNALTFPSTDLDVVEAPDNVNVPEKIVDLQEVDDVLEVLVTLNPTEAEPKTETSTPVVERVEVVGEVTSKTLKAVEQQANSILGTRDMQKRMEGADKQRGKEPSATKQKARRITPIRLTDDPLPSNATAPSSETILFCGRDTAATSSSWPPKGNTLVPEQPNGKEAVNGGIAVGSTGNGSPPRGARAADPVVAVLSRAAEASSSGLPKEDSIVRQQLKGKEVANGGNHVGSSGNDPPLSDWRATNPTVAVLRRVAEAGSSRPTEEGSVELRQLKGKEVVNGGNHAGPSGNASPLSDIKKTSVTLGVYSGDLSQSESDPEDTDFELASEDRDSATDDERSGSDESTSSEGNEEEATDLSDSMKDGEEDYLLSLTERLHETECESLQLQEMLEEESLLATRNKVRKKFSEKRFGAELDAAVEEKMEMYIDKWHRRHDTLADRSSILQDKIDDRGKEHGNFLLPDLYKWFEKLAPEGCITEAWRCRTHWAGRKPSEDTEVAVKQAQEKLEVNYPMRSQEGKLLDGGASGFLKKKLAASRRDHNEERKPSPETQNDGGWSKVEDYLDADLQEPTDIENPADPRGWAAVYLASTPEQAAQLGLALPGAASVEEIGDIHSERRAVFKAAVASETKLADRRIPIEKIFEEDDVMREKEDRKRQHRRPLLSKTAAARRRHPAKRSVLDNQARVSTFRAPPQQTIGQNRAVDSYCEGATNVRAEDVADPVRESPVNALIPRENRDEAPPEDWKHAVKLLGQSVHIPSHNGGLQQVRNADPVGHPSCSEGREELPIILLPEDRWRKRAQGDEEILPDQYQPLSKRFKNLPQTSPTPDIPDDTNPDGSQKTITLKRKILVIDSDGDFEVEEAVTEAVPLKKKKSHGDESEGKNSLQESGGAALTVYNNRRASSSLGGVSFSCTACGKKLRAGAVLKHPELPVAICKECKDHYLSGPFKKGPDGSESECRWCGEGGIVICCDNCDKVFCKACIQRNFGHQESSRIIMADEWLCYSCNPLPLSECSEKLKLAELHAPRISGDGDDRREVDPDEARLRQARQRRNHRKNIRKVMPDDQLGDEQKELQALEKERQAHLEQWRAATTTYPAAISARWNVAAPVPVLSLEDRTGLINIAREQDEEEVWIAPELNRVMKDHQRTGVRFMWENCIVSERKVREGAESFGCILAHSMGLGKTLQVIAFLHAILNRHMGLRTALIVCPVNVLHNWKKEFEMWQNGLKDPLPTYLLDESIREIAKRVDALKRWQENGGVMLIGYAGLRILCKGKQVKEKETWECLCATLQNPGPDLLVCDEAHTIKNIKADITKVLKQVKTRRRIALTGSPLQNNLMEYYCMVDFVRGGFLGSPQVFKNRFQNPIENGQHADSTSKDVKLMKQRAHVLHKQLRGFVQRMTPSVLKDELPPKCVYVISIRLSKIQRQLYTHFLKVHGLNQDAGEAADRSQRTDLFRAYHALSKIWNHPDLLLLTEDEKMKKQEVFIDEIMDDGDASDGEGDDENGERRKPRARASTEVNELERPLWWRDIITDEYSRGSASVSGKMVVLLNLLSMFSKRNEKALVFSQSLAMLDLIEYFLQTMFHLERSRPTWAKTQQFYSRIDGSTTPSTRQQVCDVFNDPQNDTTICVLISTRAGSLGINLHAANRVIIVDGSWNPVNDLQAVFRAWRMGQTKPVYAYRLIAHGTMEEKIYSRQVAKEGVAARVLDEQQVGRHFDGEDLEALFKLEDDGDDFVFGETSDGQDTPSPSLLELQLGPNISGTAIAAARSKILSFTVPDDAPPKDDVMGNILLQYRPEWVVSYHEHEPLLEHREEETLTKEEQQAAWESYQNVERVQPSAGMSSGQHYTHTAHHHGISAGVIAIQPQGSQAEGQLQLSAEALGNITILSDTVRGIVNHKPFCDKKEHALTLSRQDLSMKEEMVCPTCEAFISWEQLGGARVRNLRLVLK